MRQILKGSVPQNALVSATIFSSSCAQLRTLEWVSLAQVEESLAQEEGGAFALFFSGYAPLSIWDGDPEWSGGESDERMGASLPRPSAPPERMLLLPRLLG